MLGLFFSTSLFIGARDQDIRAQMAADAVREGVSREEAKREFAGSFGISDSLLDAKLRPAQSFNVGRGSVVQKLRGRGVSVSQGEAREIERVLGRDQRGIRVAVDGGRKLEVLGEDKVRIREGGRVRVVEGEQALAAAGVGFDGRGGLVDGLRRVSVPQSVESGPSGRGFLAGQDISSQGSSSSGFRLAGVGIGDSRVRFGDARSVLRGVGDRRLVTPIGLGEELLARQSVERERRGLVSIGASFTDLTREPTVGELKIERLAGERAQILGGVRERGNNLIRAVRGGVPGLGGDSTVRFRNVPKGVGMFGPVPVVKFGDVQFQPQETAREVIATPGRFVQSVDQARAGVKSLQASFIGFREGGDTRARVGREFESLGSQTPGLVKASFNPRTGPGLANIIVTGVGVGASVASVNVARASASASRGLGNKIFFKGEVASTPGKFKVVQQIDPVQVVSPVRPEGGVFLGEPSFLGRSVARQTGTVLKGRTSGGFDVNIVQPTPGGKTFSTFTGLDKKGRDVSVLTRVDSSGKGVGRLVVDDKVVRRFKIKDNPSIRLDDVIEGGVKEVPFESVLPGFSQRFTKESSFGFGSTRPVSKRKGGSAVDFRFKTVEKVSESARVRTPGRVRRSQAELDLDKGVLRRVGKDVTPLDDPVFKFSGKRGKGLRKDGGVFELQESGSIVEVIQPSVVVKQAQKARTRVQGVVREIPGETKGQAFKRLFRQKKGSTGQRASSIVDEITKGKRDIEIGGFDRFTPKLNLPRARIPRARAFTPFVPTSRFGTGLGGRSVSGLGSKPVSDLRNDFKLKGEDIIIPKIDESQVVIPRIDEPVINVGDTPPPPPIFRFDGGPPLPPFGGGGGGPPPPFIPIPNLGGILPFTGRGRQSARKQRSFGRTPSITAIALNIRQDIPDPKTFTGLEIRGLTGKKRKKTGLESIL